MAGDCFLVEGGHRLEGRVRISGNKNAAIHAMAATLLTSDDCYLENVPVIGDIRFMVEILRALGATVEYTSPSTLHVNAAGVHTLAAPSDLATHLRGSFLVMGPLLTRFGEAACCPPGGDIIGLRPLNVHLDGFRVLNATVSHEGDKFVARSKRLRGNRIFLDYPSVLGTQNLILAATLAEGRTTLVNAAAEPEIESLVEMLTQMGARISGAGRHTIEIEGVSELRGATHRIIPDRIEAGTFAIAAAATHGDVEIAEGVPQQLDALIWKLREAGVQVEETDGLLRVRGADSLRAINAQAVPYPGFATDLQAPLATLLTQAKGVSSIYERVFENRLLYVGELRKMGAEVITSGTTVIITGPTPLYGANVRAVDLRAGAALVLAALAAGGKSQINDIFHLDRGYERFDEKLKSLGGCVERLTDDEEQVWGRLMLTKRLGIDLGTANVLVYIRGKGIVINEPSVVALATRDNTVIAVGNEARGMIGRTPGSISVIRPMRDGVIADYLITEAMLRYFIGHALGRLNLIKPEVMVCIPAGVTSVEQRAVRDAAEQAGARRPAHLVPEPLAAAIGAGIPVGSASGNMIVDIGGGRTEAAIISMYGIVVSESIRIAGDRLDDAITAYVKRRHNLVIGDRTAEEAKMAIGSALPLEEDLTMEIRGRDQISGLPKTIVITSHEITQAIQDCLASIVQAVRSVLERTAPELASDVIDRGIVLTGGGALLRNIDTLLTQETGVPCHIAENPMNCTAIGAGAALEHLDVIKRSLPTEEESLVASL